MKRSSFKTAIMALAILSLAGGETSCSKYLDKEPNGVVSADVLADANGAELLVTAAYSSLGNGDEYSSVSDWIWGGIRSDDAYKGGASTGDQPVLNDFELFAFIVTTEPYLESVWTENYSAIARDNAALTAINALSTTTYPQKVERQAEMRFLRGHFYFWLEKAFKNIPWIDETMNVAQEDTVSNRAYSRDQIYEKIAADFQFAVDNLPQTQSQVGRPTRYAAMAYLARTRLYQAYQQDDQHNVTGINNANLQQVVSLTDSVINSKSSLNPDFGDNYLFPFENGPEAVFSIQFSINDGTPIGRADWSHNLNYSMNPNYGCCSFSRPSDNLVNAFRTGADGLPLFDTYDAHTIAGPQDFITNSFDPRLDHTVAIPGHPFKYTPTFVVDSTWGRAPEVYGYYSTMKECMAPGSPALVRNGSRLGSARNIDVLRFDDVLLWKAEALIELNDAADALPIINQIRQRAANSKGMLKKADATPISNYNIQTYVDGVNCTWTQAYARQALRWERRLEFAMEDSRFFDLVRWGIADSTINHYFQTESSRHSFLNAGKFQKNRNEYLPIPEAEITLSRGIYKQNPGY